MAVNVKDIIYITELIFIVVVIALLLGLFILMNYKKLRKSLVVLALILIVGSTQNLKIS